MLLKINDFNLKHILECGQCFRWDKLPDGSYTIVAKGQKLRVLQETEEPSGTSVIRFFDTTKEQFDSIWSPYFDLSCDYGKIKKLYKNDPIKGGNSALSKAISYGWGIRILRQDVWETLISFIISSNNNIPRIKKIIEALCVNFGENYGDFFSFPPPEKLVSLNREDFSPLRAGYRVDYIMDAAHKVAESCIDLNILSRCPLDEARSILRTIKGVGPKVADCVLLFGAGRTDAFPIDVWMRRTLEKYYPTGAPNFGEYSGIIQQYLFYWARETM